MPLIRNNMSTSKVAVDKYLGTSYDIIKTVYDNLGDINLAATAITSGDIADTLFIIETESQLGSQAVSRVFTLTGVDYVVGTNNLTVYRNGQRLEVIDDYIESGSALVTLTFDPNADDKFYFITNERTDTAQEAPATTNVVFERQIATAGQTVVTLGTSYVTGSNGITVFVNGVLQTTPVEYAETSNGVITMVNPLTAGDNIDIYVGLVLNPVPADAVNLTFTQNGTGAVATTVQAKLEEIVSVKDFDVIGDGDGAGGGTDDSAAIQLALDHIVDNGGTLEFDGTKTYRCDSALTAELSGANQIARWRILGNGATLDCSNHSGASVGLTIGDSSLTNFNEKGYYFVSDLRVLGPEAVTPINESTSVTTFTGILVVYAIRTLLINVECTRCYVGLKTAVAFPVTTMNCNVENNFIGLHLDDVSNVHIHNNLSAKQCWYSVLIIKSGTYSSAKIEDVTFNGLWTEGSRVGVHLDPGTNAANRIREIKFNGGFYKTVTYDNWRIGQVFTFATPQTRGAKGTGKIYNVSVNGGAFPGAAATATAAVFTFTNTSNCFGFYGHGSFDDTDANTIVNAPSWGDFLVTGNEAAETISGFKRLTWKNSDEYRLPEVPHANTQVPVYIPAPDEPSPGPYAGTWTPVLTFATAPTTPFTYTTQVGTYTKIGRLVTLSFTVLTSSFDTTGAAGEFRISGIPHNPRTLTGYEPVGIVTAQGISKTGYTQVNVEASSASSVINLVACNPATSAISTVAFADMPSLGTVRLKGTLTYETDA